MRAIFTAMAVSIGVMAPVTASADAVLVELYTSQGCSSCPPADEILGKLAKRDDVIALSLHVDYWDYLGWKDVFADPAFTKRQQAYARAARENMIYTPQMVIGGVDSVVGTRTMELMDYISMRQKASRPVSLTLSKSAGQIDVDASSTGVGGEWVVQLVRYIPKQAVEIKRGENAGRTVTYHNVVSSWNVIGTWNGEAPLQLSAPLDGDAPSVVVIQDGTSGPVLAVARLD
jgi:hypothetical protein